MNGAKSFGFCDLNISTEGDVRETAIQALKLGYKVIALNTEISDEIIVTKRNKKGTYTEIPPPIKFTLTKEELKKNGLIQEPKILSRITIKFSQPSSPFIHKSRDAILKYDLIAYKPLTEAAFKHLCQSNVDVDMISFDTSDSLYRPSRKLLNLAVKSDVYFELCYGPCLRSASCRLKTIQLWHDMHRLFRCLNAVMASGARTPLEVRNPYDVANLGLLFGLTPAGAKMAVSKYASDLLHCANLRRCGGAKCAALVEAVPESPRKRGKYDSLLRLDSLVEGS